MPKQPWEEVYDKFYDENEAGGSSRWLVSPSTVKIFIKGLLMSRDKQLKEMKKKVISSKSVSERGVNRRRGYNQAISDVLTKLNQLR